MIEKALGIAEFGEMAHEQQLNLLHKEGVYVGKRKHEQLTTVLFQLHGFYVEVYYKMYRKEIDHLVISDDAEILQPYLDQIEVHDWTKR